MEDAECVAATVAVKMLIDLAYDFLSSTSKKESLRRGYTAKFTGAYKAALLELTADISEASTQLQSLEASFKNKKIVLKKFRKRLRNVILQEIAEEMKAQL
jgi:ABC-type phosphate transport system auxiliary subunit